MTEARRRDAWERTSWVICAVVNSQRTKRDKLVSPSQFNPFADHDAQPVDKIKDPKILAAWCGIKVD